MMNDSNQEDDGGSLVSIRTMEIVVAALFLLGSVIVVQDALRVGVGWAENEGPRAGYFPFYVGLIMGGASLVTLGKAILAHGATESFVGRKPFGRVLFVLVPMAVYILALTMIGIYVASAIYIALFMIFLGKFRIHASVAVGVVAAIALFFMFEIWFLVPLPKGPLEAMLGY